MRTIFVVLPSVLEFTLNISDGDDGEIVKYNWKKQVRRSLTMMGVGTVKANVALEVDSLLYIYILIHPHANAIQPCIYIHNLYIESFTEMAGASIEDAKLTFHRFYYSHKKTKKIKRGWIK